MYVVWQHTIQTFFKIFSKKILFRKNETIQQLQNYIWKPILTFLTIRLSYIKYPIRVWQLDS